MNKGTLSNVLRNLKIIYWVDYLRFYYQKFKNRTINRDFKLMHPEVVLPPDYLMYEAFQVNYKKYYTESKNTAQWLVDYLKKYIELKNLNILDWGCGPGRIIRHLPEVIGNNCQYYGTDYNLDSINWCKKNLTSTDKKLHFNHNTIEAMLPYETNFFDVIYGISIFTHLSEEMHHSWHAELYRVLKPGGVLFVTTHGNNFKIKLDSSEKQLFNLGKLVVRGKVKEGHRTFAAFQPKEFMLKLFTTPKLLLHEEPEPQKGKWLPQDIWIVQK